MSEITTVGIDLAKQVFSIEVRTRGLHVKRHCLMSVWKTMHE